jgi:hypothetical protein
MSWIDRLFGRRISIALLDEARLNRERMLASLLVMAWVVEARDPYTGGHLWRVSRFSSLLAERAGIAAEECARIALGGFLHDLGKVAIPDAVLRKSDRLSPEEYAIVKTHPSVGARMLAGHPLAGLVLDAVLLHHETPDGCGYPHGLDAKDIPIAARIVGICDAFDAMTSTRPYRRGMPIPAALEQIEASAGRQFDPFLAGYLQELGRAGLLEHIVGHSDDGIPLLECRLCGPTLVVRREQRSGESIFCRSCGGGYRIVGSDGDTPLHVVPSGLKATPIELEPHADTALIGRFVRDTAQRALLLA